MTIKMKPHKFSISDILTRPPCGSHLKQPEIRGKFFVVFFLVTKMVSNVFKCISKYSTLLGERF